MSHRVYTFYFKITRLILYLDIQTTRNQTKSLNKQELPDASIEKLRTGALR